MKKEHCVHFVLCYCLGMDIKVSQLIGKIHEHASVDVRDKASTRLTIQAMHLENALFDLQFELGGSSPLSSGSEGYD